ncbi:MAG: cytochrome C [Epsilonproteobacteria bacterium]|nr:cytochrome C [Campylobacterota bacterium]NPA89151.1 cytochrome C [Campylobacterota bacterium]
MKKIALVALVSAGFVFASTDCAMCHKANGTAAPLDNLTPAQIVQKMKEFKAGKGNPMMVNIAKGMSDEEIKKSAEKYGKK